MKAAVLQTSGAHDIVELEPGPMGPTDVTVRITASNACITDVYATKSQYWFDSFPSPQVLGHGGAGIVEEVGAACKRIKVGDRVIMTSNPMCNRCIFCVTGRPDMCAEIVSVGPPHHYAPSSGRTGEVYPHNWIGGYAQIAVLPETQVTAITADVSDGALALLADGLGAGLGASLITAPIRRGASVAVLGCGAVGLGYIQGAKVARAEPIIGIDPLAHRREVALELGATHVLDPGEVDVVEAVREITSDAAYGPKWSGSEFTYEAAGYDPKTIEQAFHMTMNGGNIVLASMFWKEEDGDLKYDLGRVDLPAWELSLRGKTIYSSQYGWIHVIRDLPRFARLIEKGEVDDYGRWTEEFPLEEINEAMERVWRREVLSALIRPND